MTAEGAGLRVVMTADAVGGIWTYALDLATALRARGAAVTLALLGPGPDGGQRDAAARAGLDLALLGHPPEWLATDAAAVGRAGAALAALAGARGADLLHLNHPALAAATPFGVPVLALAHSCLATWWEAAGEGPLPAGLAWQADLVGEGYRRASRLAAPTRAFALATQARYGLPARPAVVPNGRAAPPPAAPPEPAPHGFTAGRLWDAGKDADTLDRAAALARTPIRAAGPLAGPEGSRAALRHLDLLGTLPGDGVRAILAARPVYLSAARYEPFGLSVLEAAQAGCALVLSDIPSHRELWDGAAVFVPSGDAAGFAGALDALVADPGARAERGAAADARARRYGLDAQADATLGLYGALLGRAAAA